MKIGTPSSYIEIPNSPLGRKPKSPITLAILDPQIGQQLPVEFNNSGEKMGIVARVHQARKHTPGRKCVVRTTGKNVVTAYCIAA